MKSFWNDPDDFQPSNKCNAWVATAVIGSAVIGAGASIYGSNKAASAQEQAAQSAQDLQAKQYAQTRADLAPYRDIGSAAATQLTNNDYYTAPINMDQATLEQTPGYQFTQTQGLKATQNAAAARGLGVSGAALKGAATFATGLADKTYLDQFNVANTNQTNAYNRLKGLVDTGSAAAAGTAVSGSNAANQSSAAAIGSGNAQAAAANAQGGSVTNLANGIGGYMAYKGLYGSNSGGGANYSGVTPSQTNYWASGNVGPVQ